MNSKDLFLIIGLIFTNLIHCTWKFGNTSNIMLVLSNNIGRCGLFLFVLFLGGYIYRNRQRSMQILVRLLSIYVVSFILNILVNCYLGIDLEIKSVLLEFVRGTPGNIWIIYGSIVFCVLMIFYERFVVLEDRKVIIIIGTVYSIIALVLFCYANIYSSFVSIDNGLILKLFHKILGTNRSPYILAIPFLFAGALLEEYHLKVTIAPTIALFIIWCVEVFFINLLTGNYNIYMTIVGMLSTVTMYTFIKSRLKIVGDLSAGSVTFYTLLFSIQYSVNSFVESVFKINMEWKSLTWYVLYCLIIVQIIYLIKVGEKNGKRSFD